MSLMQTAPRLSRATALSEAETGRRVQHPVNASPARLLRKCLHGLHPDFCAPCRARADRAPLPENPLRLTKSGIVALVVRELLDGRVRIVVSENAATLLEVSGEELLPYPKTEIRPFDRTKLQSVVERAGLLFVPQYALTWREWQEELGSPSCYECRAPLDYDRGSLGCTQCRYYACNCGRCLCGVTARNWMGQLFTQSPGLPIQREDRVEFIRTLRFLIERRRSQ